MNREQIMQLEGRELDEAIAIKVMNLCVLDTLQLYGDGCVVSDRGIVEWMKHPMYGKTEDPDFLEPYSTDMNAAWEVVEKINDPWWIHLEVTGQSWYACNFWNYKTGEQSETVHFQTAPEAICKASLLAVMEVES